MPTPSVIKTTICPTPCGDLLLGDCRGRLCMCDWQTDYRPYATVDRLRRHLRVSFQPEITPLLCQAIKQLDEYFAATRVAFDLLLHFVGTDFQKQVWGRLLDIPYGTTTTYRAIAASIQKPGAVRAVANSVAVNPITIIAPLPPCPLHRTLRRPHGIPQHRRLPRRPPSQNPSPPPRIPLQLSSR